MCQCQFHYQKIWMGFANATWNLLKHAISNVPVFYSTGYITYSVFYLAYCPCYLISGNVTVIYHPPIWILQWCQLRCQQHGSDHSSWLGSAWGSEHCNPSTFPIQNVKLRVKQKTTLCDIFFLALHCYAKNTWISAFHLVQCSGRLLQT